MGIYSKGILIVKTETFLMEQLVKQNTPDFINNMDRSDIEDAGRKLTIFKYASLKMYPEFDNVKEFYAWMETLNKNDFQYIEICEDHDEYVEEGDLAIVYVEQYVSLDGEVII